MEFCDVFAVVVCVAQILSQTFALHFEDLMDVCIGDGDERFPVIKHPNVTAPCAEWHHKSCCSGDTVPKVDTIFNYDHCGRKMSDRCKNHFHLRTCFKHCSPNLGPWLEDANGTLKRFSAKYVPLCREECELWWNDCKHESTCVENWSKDFLWQNGTNSCPPKKECKPFSDVYKDSTYFCEHVHGPFDFLVANDGEHCMMIFERISDNVFVAQRYAEKMAQDSAERVHRFSLNLTESKKEYCANTLKDVNPNPIQARHLIMCFFLGVLLAMIGMGTGYCFVTKRKTKKFPYSVHTDERPALRQSLPSFSTPPPTP